MNVIFLCGVFPSVLEAQILKESKGVVQFAANKFQKNIIAGFKENGISDIKIVSAPFIGAYPNMYTKAKMDEYQYLDEHGYEVKSVGFFNLWGARNISRERNILKALHSVNVDKDNPTIIIVYSLHTPLVSAAYEFKKKNPNTIICCIVPDLPQFMLSENEKSLMYKVFKAIDMSILKKKINYIDRFVFLTEKMNDVLNKNGKPYIVLEGIVSSAKIKKPYKETDSNQIKVVYSGTLNRVFGVSNLVEAFLNLENSNMKLIICGKGEIEKEIAQISEKNDQIVYLGQISNDEAIKIQLEADILVNPRQNKGEYTKYSFPSKNLEYLKTGNPLIAYKLDGIPDDYDKHIYYVTGDSIEDLQDTLQKVSLKSKEEIYEFGRKAQEFVMENKVAGKSVKRIIDLIQTHIK